jgi:hypothetical protein
MTVTAIGEGIQADEGLLQSCATAGIIPGSGVTVEGADGQFVVSGANGSVALDAQLAAQLFVVA